MPTLTALPDRLIAGDSYDITLSVAAYPATAGWSVSLSIAGAERLDVASTPVGEAHRFLLTPNATSLLVAGLYQVRLRAEKDAGAIAETFHTGALAVDPDVGAAVAGELQSYAEQMLALCREARRNILAGETKLYMIDGRQVQFHSLAEVAKEEAHWRRELAAERRGSAFLKRTVTFVRG